MPSALLFGLPRRGERDAREATGRVVGTLFVTFVVMLLVGGVYYLVRRPRVTFWGAVFGRWVVLIGAIVLLLGLLGQAKDDVAPAILI